MYPSHPERGHLIAPFSPTSNVFECYNQTHSSSVGAGKHAGLMSVSDVGNGSFVFNHLGQRLPGIWQVIMDLYSPSISRLLSTDRGAGALCVSCITRPSPVCRQKSVCSPGWRYVVLGFSLHTCLLSLHMFPFTRWCNVVLSLVLGKKKKKQNNKWSCTSSDLLHCYVIRPKTGL